MKYIIRDDIIDPISYAYAEIKFKDILFKIYNSGNYCLLEQFNKNIKNARRIIEQLEELNLVSIKIFNGKSKVIMLTQTAMKYLLLRNSDTEFDNLSKNQINVTRVSNEPSDKMLFSSALKFEMICSELFESKNQLINDFSENMLLSFSLSSNAITNLRTHLNKLKENESELLDFKNKLLSLSNSVNSHEEQSLYIELIDNKHVQINNAINLQLEQIEQTKPLIESIKRVSEQLNVYFDNSKILFKYNGIDKILDMFILDTGNHQTPWAYMKYPKTLVELGVLVDKINIEIVSYNQMRAESLKDQFLSSIKLSNEADAKMKAWEIERSIYKAFRKTWNFKPSKINRKHEPPDTYLKMERIWGRFRLLDNINLFEKTFYLEKHRNYVVHDDGVIKSKDIETIENLKSIFKND